MNMMQNLLLYRYFVNLPSLSVIYLNRNVVTSIDNYSFSGLPSLIRIELGGNDLEVITRYMFWMPTSLQKLYLQNNRLVFNSYITASLC